jgi:hypothetical protein
MKEMGDAAALRGHHSNHTWIVTSNMFKWSHLSCLQIQSCLKECVSYYHDTELADGF